VTPAVAVAGQTAGPGRGIRALTQVTEL